MNASAWPRAASPGARSGCIRLAASRNRRLMSPVGSGPGALGTARMWAVVSRTRSRALRAASASSCAPALGGAWARLRVVARAGAGPEQRQDAGLELLDVEHHRHDLAHVVRIE